MSFSRYLTHLNQSSVFIPTPLDGRADMLPRFDRITALLWGNWRLTAAPLGV